MTNPRKTHLKEASSRLPAGKRKGKVFCPHQSQAVGKTTTMWLDAGAYFGPHRQGACRVLGLDSLLARAEIQSQVSFPYPRNSTLRWAIQENFEVCAVKQIPRIPEGAELYFKMLDMTEQLAYPPGQLRGSFSRNGEERE